MATKLGTKARPMLPPLVGTTFLKSPKVTIDELGPQNIAVVGIPYEGTKVSRLGCKNGPTAIREATFMFAYLLQLSLIHISEPTRPY